MISRRAWSALLILAWQVSGQQEAERVNTCIRQVTCRECLRTPTCMWCDDPKLGKAGKGPPIRCQSNISAVPADWCSEEHVVNPRPESHILKDSPLKGAKEALSPDGVVQIRPQSIKLRLRVGETLELPIQYRQAEDYPVDLYYLMDLSASMDDDKESLSLLGDKMAATMSNITGNFRLGFGSFVDKVVMPFTSTVPSRLESPCVLSDGRKCARPYGFKNHMPLTTDTKIFKSEVQKAPVSGNLDAPEGGFDAIMQAMVCHQQIGWRPKARHLLVFSTDADFHMAGDGRVNTFIFRRSAIGRDF